MKKSGDRPKRRAGTYSERRQFPKRSALSPDSVTGSSPRFSQLGDAKSRRGDGNSALGERSEKFLQMRSQRGAVCRANRPSLVPQCCRGFDLRRAAGRNVRGQQNDGQQQGGCCQTHHNHLGRAHEIGAEGRPFLRVHHS